MSIFEADGAFSGHCLRQGFLAQCEDYGLLWQTYCMGGEPYLWTFSQ